MFYLKRQTQIIELRRNIWYESDLLVRKSYRGRKIGKTLMERVLKDFPNQPIYVMSDVDPYYEKLGYRREGSIFEVKA